MKPFCRLLLLTAQRKHCATNEEQEAARGFRHSARTATTAAARGPSGVVAGLECRGCNLAVRVRRCGRVDLGARLARRPLSLAIAANDDIVEILRLT